MYLKHVIPSPTRFSSCADYLPWRAHPAVDFWTKEMLTTIFFTSLVCIVICYIIVRLDPE